MSVPRILVSALSGGGGKTLASVGLAAAWKHSGRCVAPFKKGPDYIDAAWLSRAAGVACRNLDLFLMEADAVQRSFASGAAGSDVAVVEGNRGLYDGADARGTWSSAELAKLLSTPVILVLDCTKTTRTAAALVLGCQHLDPDVHFGGVVLNRVAGSRHESVLRQSIESVCGVPVLGAFPRLRSSPFPERHLGLVPPQEHDSFEGAVESARRLAEQYLDLGAIWEVAATAPELPTTVPEAPHQEGGSTDTVRIGVFRDAAFQFYYAENLEALEREGAELVDVSPLTDTALPHVDALYIGGGFPETLADRLADNRPFRESLRSAVDRDLPVYAECGGAVYLGEELWIDGTVYPMAGAIPATFAMGERPNGHGYVVLEAVNPNPFYEQGTSLRGHEFHYTRLRSVTRDDVAFAFRVERGHGYDGMRDGLCHRNVLASYTHVHALGIGSWAAALVGAAARYRHESTAADLVTP